MGLGMDRTAPRLQPEKALGMTEIRKKSNPREKRIPKRFIESACPQFVLTLTRLFKNLRSDFCEKKLLLFCHLTSTVAPTTLNQSLNKMD